MTLFQRISVRVVHTSIIFQHERKVLMLARGMQGSARIKEIKGSGDGDGDGGGGEWRLATQWSDHLAAVSKPLAL